MVRRPMLLWGWLSRAAMRGPRLRARMMRLSLILRTLLKIVLLRRRLRL